MHRGTAVVIIYIDRPQYWRAHRDASQHSGMDSIKHTLRFSGFIRKNLRTEPILLKGEAKQASGM